MTDEPLAWYDGVDLVKPYVVKIQTPAGSGTGFLLARSPSGGICGVATAAHVIAAAHQWEQPVRVEHFESGENLLLRHDDRAVFIDNVRDRAAIIFIRKNIPFDHDPLDITPQDSYLRVGSEIGWLGFPALSPNDLCFLGGRISSCQEDRDFYLVDGVAINGVSGGPAFSSNPTGGITVNGVVSAYVPNRATGEALPGLMIVSGVSGFHDVVATLDSLEKAKELEEEHNPSLDEPPGDAPADNGA